MKKRSIIKRKKIEKLKISEQKFKEFDKILKKIEPFLAKGDEKVESTSGKWVETTKTLEMNYSL
jgi:hypothetical protein